MVLLFFPFQIIPHFHPPLADKVRAGVHNSLRQILEKRVIQALEPLFDSPRMDVELRKLIRETFPEFCSASAVSDVKPEDYVAPVSSAASVTRMDLMAETGLDFATSSVPESVVNNNNHSEDEGEAMFSDEEEDVPTSKINSSTPPVPIKMEKTEEKEVTGVLPVGDVKLKQINNVNVKEEKMDLSKHLEFLESDMRSIIIDFQNETDTQQRCYLLQKMCDLILSDDLVQEESQNLASCLCPLLADDLSPGVSLLPQDITPESIQESLGRPLFVLFDNLITLPEDDHRRQPLLQLLVEMHKITSSVGYIFLYFLKASTIRAEKEDEKDDKMFLTYRDLCKASGQKDFAGFIIRDLVCCSENDSRVLSWIIPDVYKSFPKQTRGSSDILQIVIERLDSTQLHDLVCMVLQGSLVMFDNGAFANILEKSLQWETMEQLFLWQLAKAHEIPVDCCLSVMPRLKFTSHSATVNNTHGEALSNILMMLRRESTVRDTNCRSELNSFINAWGTFVF
ncbi:hypothetical protein SK128_026783 [Halocaridina rubra]|uniref:SOSS complex subunit A homolog n=1 Tax=Halocaridina rubra TaxID=373956 RepID=A0AAN8XEN4_HALRR